MYKNNKNATNSNYKIEMYQNYSIGTLQHLVQ